MMKSAAFLALILSVGAQPFPECGAPCGCLPSPCHFTACNYPCTCVGLTPQKLGVCTKVMANATAVGDPCLSSGSSCNPSGTRCCSGLTCGDGGGGGGYFCMSACLQKGVECGPNSRGKAFSCCAGTECTNWTNPYSPTTCEPPPPAPAPGGSDAE